jgi:hypothetical protein
MVGPFLYRMPQTGTGGPSSGQTAKESATWRFAQLAQVLVSGRRLPARSSSRPCRGPASRRARILPTRLWPDVAFPTKTSTMGGCDGLARTRPVGA